MKDIEILVKKYPEKPWCWKYLTVNENISPQFIIKNLDYKWDIKNFLANPNITLKFVEKHLKTVEWCMYKLSRMVTVEFLKKHPDLDYKWGSNGLSNNPNVTYEFFSKFPDKEWDFSANGLSKNPNMGIKFFKIYKDNEEELRIDPSMNPNATYDIIKLYRSKVVPSVMSKYIKVDVIDQIIKNEKKCNFVFNSRGISVNPYLRLDFLLKYINKDWDWSIINVDFNSWENPPITPKIWRGLSSNPNIDLKFIETNIDKAWDFSANGLSSNPIIRDWFVVKYKDKNWSYGLYGLSDNPGITEKIINKSFDFKSLSKHKGVSLRYIKRHNGKHNKWNYDDINLNPNLTIHNINGIEMNFKKLSINRNINIKIIEAFVDEDWDWKELSK